MGKKLAATAITLLFIGFLTLGVLDLPAFGQAAEGAVYNEVTRRYLEGAQAETGAVNAVAAMILDYRAFDTFLEAGVLFTALLLLLVLLAGDRAKPDGLGVAWPTGEAGSAMRGRLQRSEGAHADAGSLSTPVVAGIVRWLLPPLLVFSFYIMLFGHLSPGGGFSGGSLLGACLILDRYADGGRAIGRRLTEPRALALTAGALCLMALLKGQTFVAGALHLAGLAIPLGEPGRIASAGLLVPLNLLVGLVVGLVFYRVAILLEEEGS